jgi:lysyl hydroxylase/galactosyltransferase/glucosyltransferase
MTVEEALDSHGYQGILDHAELSQPMPQLQQTSLRHDVRQLSSAFEQTFAGIYAIGLESRPERMLSLRRQLHALRLETTPFHHILAVDQDAAMSAIRNAKVKAFPDFRDPEQERAMTLGEVGCTISHIAAWKKIAAYEASLEPGTSTKWFIVMEDDAELNDEFAGHSSGAIGSLTRRSLEVDLLYLGRKALRPREEARRMKDTSDPAVNLPRGIHPVEYSYWTVGYALAPGAAAKLLALEPAQAILPVDELLNLAFGVHPDQARFLPGLPSGFSKDSMHLRPASLSPAAMVVGQRSFAHLGQAVSATETSRPVVCHNTAACLQLSQLSATVPPFPSNPMQDGRTFLLIAAATHKTDATNLLERQAAFFGESVFFAGIGKEWPTGPASGRRGGAAKLAFFRDALQNAKDAYPASTWDSLYVVLTDAYSVAMVRSSASILKGYDQVRRRQGVPEDRASILVAAERSCWPNASLAERYPWPPTPEGYEADDDLSLLPQFVDSSLVMGQAAILLEELSSPAAMAASNPQTFWSNRYLASFDAGDMSVVLDYASDVFQSLGGNEEAEPITEYDLSFNRRTPVTEVLSTMPVSDLVQLAPRPGSSDESARFVRSRAYGTLPALVHGNGPTGRERLGPINNFCANGFHAFYGERRTADSMDMEATRMALRPGTNLQDRHPGEASPAATPHIVVAMLYRRTPFAVDWLLQLAEFRYPRQQLSVFLWAEDDSWPRSVDSLLNASDSRSLLAASNGFRRVHMLTGASGRFQTEAQARSEVIRRATRWDDAEAIFFLDSTVLLRRPRTIHDLLSTGKGIVSPALAATPSMHFSFGFRTGRPRFPDPRRPAELLLVDGIVPGIFEVPHVAHAVLVRREVFTRFPFGAQVDDHFGSVVAALEAADAKRMSTVEGGHPVDAADVRRAITRSYDYAFSEGMLRLVSGYPMYVDARFFYGDLLQSADRLDVSTLGRAHPDLYQRESNPIAWRYAFQPKEYVESVVRAGLSLAQVKNRFITEVCPSVFSMRLFNERFALFMVEEAEHQGGWSKGTTGDGLYYDSRLGGTEAYPTVDIHMPQMHLQEMYNEIVSTDYADWFRAVFPGSTARHQAPVAFVSRYRASEQGHLSAHDDSSIYTTVFGLNQVGRDFLGGGAHFTRFNCTFSAPAPGIGIMHPGRLTHRHEGLPTTEGTRYLMVSFNM